MTTMIENDTLHLKSRQVAEEILANLKKDVGVDLLPIFLDTTRDARELRREAATRLFEALVARAQNSNDAAEWTGSDEGVLRAFAADVDVEPNMIYTEENLKTLKGMRGQEIYDYLYSLTKRFEAMSKATSPGQLALQIIGAGLLSVSVPMAIGTIQALRVAGTTVAAALRAGIANIGMKTAVLAIAVALTTLIWWLIHDNPKKILGLVINETDEHLVVRNWRAGTEGGTGADLYMAHGDMKSFPQDYEEGVLAKKIQINKRAYFGPGDKENACYAGIFFAEKKTGFYGTEGIIVFSSTEGTPRFAQVFACPYTKDNGTAGRVLNGWPDVQKLFDDLYDKRQVNFSTKEHGHEFVSSVNDARGGVAACISSFRKA
ncbi:MAG TPA: hypothetical protein VM733_20500 [Thermoanaerobaculia bacterium]|nr:hypothetical protein [Thermoanaerobaculia bacterium]